jgi:metallo-beta-lactamase family protein
MILDTPMGSAVSELFLKYASWHRLPVEDCVRMFGAFRIVKEYAETWEVIRDEQPKIVIAGSGMAGGGRVLAYLMHYLDKPETAVLLAGFQAEGTRGRALLEGAAELKIHGKYVDVKASVYDLQVLSAHADQQELIHWLGDLQRPPRRVFIVHAEPHAADAFRVKLRDVYGWEAVAPEMNEKIEIPDEP